MGNQKGSKDRITQTTFPVNRMKAPQVSIMGNGSFSPGSIPHSRKSKRNTSRNTYPENAGNS